MKSLAEKIQSAEEQRKGSDTVLENADLKELYEKAKNMDPSKAMRFVQQAQDDEERKFYAFIADMNLQRAQKKAIERNLF